MAASSSASSRMAPAWRRLLSRHQGKTLVELCRRPKIQERIAGFVVGFSDELILLHMLDWSTFTLNGYVIVRDRDIKEHRFFSRDAYWQKRAIHQRKLKPKLIPLLRLDSWQEAIAGIMKLYPLINILRELKYPDECQIGKTLEVTERQIVLDNLSSSAEWTGPYRMKLDDITRIEFDGGYERALAMTALGRGKGLVKSLRALQGLDLQRVREPIRNLAL